jgi:flagellin
MAAAATTNLAITALGGAAAAPVEGAAFSLVLAGGAAGFEVYDTGTATTSSAITYVAQDGDTATEIAAGLAAAFTEWSEYNGFDELADSLTVTATGGTLAITGGAGSLGTFTGVQVNVNAADGTGEHVKGGGELSKLGFIDVTTAEGANLALGAIEDLIQTSINTAAQLGSSGKQIDTQAEFVGKLSDLLTSGIGTLVDADMEAASAKLQALQTQQQLGVQALSIANQAPQTILSLFR